MQNKAVKQPQFIVRFDDICPTMNWAMWGRIEAVLYETGVQPIVAVVPDNRDPELMVDPVCESFWASVRAWEGNGWCVAMHGYQHTYVTNHPGLVRLQKRSEFAGLPQSEQARKLTLAQGIFHRERIDPKVWIAPAHSFEWNTVEVLRTLGLSVISDGFSRFPYCDRFNMLWVPQQLWRFHTVPPGVWTVCYHHNHWTEYDFARFCHDIKSNLANLTSLTKLAATYNDRKANIDDYVFQAATRAIIYSAERYGRLRSYVADAFTQSANARTQL